MRPLLVHRYWKDSIPFFGMCQCRHFNRIQSRQHSRSHKKCRSNQDCSIYGLMKAWQTLASGMGDDSESITTSRFQYASLLPVCAASLFTESPPLDNILCSPRQSGATSHTCKALCSQHPVDWSMSLLASRWKAIISLYGLSQSCIAKKATISRSIWPEDRGASVR